MTAAVQLSHCAYGKTGVRLLKVERNGARHDVRDLDVAIRVFGAFETSYSEGDNRSVLPTDTMKNTVYVLARQQPLGEIENFGSRIANHFLCRNPQVTRIRIAISEKIWERMAGNGKAHDSAFQLADQEIRTAMIDADRTKTSIYAGIKNLVVLKTSGSAFENFLRDEYTTLKETRDRLFASTVNAEWLYSSEPGSFSESWQCVRATLLDVFATHDSRSVQHTLYAMGQAALRKITSIEQVWLSLPNQHCLLVDLSPFDLDNPNEVFVPVEEPSGLIEATLNRTFLATP